MTPPVRSSAVITRSLLAHAGDQEDVVVDAEGDEEHEREQRLGGVGLVEDDGADPERERVGQQHGRDHVQRRDDAAQQDRDDQEHARERDRDDELASARRVAWESSTSAVGPPTSAPGSAWRASSRTCGITAAAASVNGSWLSVTRTSASRLVDAEADEVGRVGERAVADGRQRLADDLGVDEHVDGTGLAGRELLLQLPQALHRLGRVAELLAEVERPAGAEVAERAGDQDHEHADRERQRLRLDQAPDPRPDRRRLAVFGERARRRAPRRARAAASRRRAR